MSDPSAHSGNTQYIGNMPSSGGGGGGGTPNVAIAGTDASGLPIASPVLSGNDSLDNVTLIGGNTNTGFRSVVFGTNNTNSGDNSLVAGQENKNAGQKNIIGGGNNNVAGYENGVSGSNNTIDSNSTRNGVSGANNSLIQSSLNDVSGANNYLIQSSSNDVSGYDHILTNTSIQNRVSGNNHKLNNVVNSNVSGYSHDIAPLSGSGADYNDISGNGHLIRGDYNRVSGGSNSVQTVGANVHGTNHVVEGSFSDVNGESNRVGEDGINAHAEGNLNDASGAYSHVQGQGNTAKFAQHVAGRYAVVDPTAVDTVPTAGQKVEIVGWGTDDANRKTIRSLDDSGNQFISGNQSFTGGKGILGRTSGAGTDAGVVGELIQSIVSSGSAVSLTTNTDTSITSIVLTPGVWDVFGTVNFSAVGGTQTPALESKGWLHTLVAAADDYTVWIPTPTATALTYRYGGTLTNRHFNVSANTTIYLLARTSFTAGTMKAYGVIRAWRKC